MRVERRGDVMEITVDNTPVRHVLEREEALALADMIYNRYGYEELYDAPISGDSQRQCPLTSEGCLGPQCAWWVEGDGLLGECAIATLARHQVIASRWPDEDWRDVFEL